MGIAERVSRGFVGDQLDEAGKPGGGEGRGARIMGVGKDQVE